MIRNFSLCLAALLAATPVLAQSVIVSESAVKTQPLSPSLGGTETLAIVSPALADALIEVPTVAALPPSGEVLPSLGDVETLAIVTPAQAEALTRTPGTTTVSAEQQSGTFFLGQTEPSVIDTLPRIEPALAATIVLDTLSVSPDAPDAEEDVSIYVVGDGAILPASEWGATDSQTCKSSGGVELPLPGNRIACFKL